MDDFCLLGICFQVARHAVRETHANGNEHIALLFLKVDCIVAVHTQHSDIQWMV